VCGRLCRTHFNYDVAEHGEVSFKRGDVFAVVDTLYGGVVGSWQAMRIVRGSPQAAKKGVIPNLSRYGCVDFHVFSQVHVFVYIPHTVCI